MRRNPMCHVRKRRYSWPAGLVMVSSYVNQRWCIIQLWRRRAAAQEKGLSIMFSTRMDTLLTCIIEQKAQSQRCQQEKGRCQQ